MAGKLKDDHIRWILDIEATGVQAELQKITSSSLQYADANKKMKTEIKEAEKQMKDCLKEMKLLEKQGKQTSDTYAQYENTLESARAEVEDYNRRIAENTQKIAENEKKHTEIIKTMKLEDMTMDQLKSRAKELQSQMNHTSSSLSPEAYKKLDKELAAVNNRIGVVKNTNKSMLQQFAGMNHPIGTAAKAVQGFGTALKALIANPVGIAIMVIVTAFMALSKVIKSSEEATNLLNQILAPLKALLDAILNVLQNLVVKFLEFVQVAISGISNLLAKIPGLEKAMGKVNEKAKEAIQLEKDKQALQIRQREQLVETAKKELEISKLRNDAKRKDLFSDEERLSKLNEAIKLEKEISEEKVFQAKESLRLLELEAARTHNVAEINDKLAQARANVYNAEKEHYDKTRRLESEISSTTLEIQRGRVEASKKALEQRIKNEDNALIQEINLLKKRKLEGELTEKEYNKKVEELTIDSLHKKISIKGQEKDKILQLEQQLLDAQLKQQESADKEILELLKKEKDKELQLLEVSKNAQLEKLQETETDRSIYALRAAEIESQIAEARLVIIEQFSETLKQAEFNNNQIRLEAIEENGKNIVDSEAKLIKEREKLQKQFAKTTADFERQYNVKTWEQRRLDELNVLQKQYEAGLLSLETKKIAESVIEKKYEDEKLKIRQQYGLVSMAELYNSEMEALEEQHRLMLISEEEYQKAQNRIKLDYAQKYAQEVKQYIGATSDTVSALMSAETANVEARYDAEIAAAGTNAEEVERLENEKAQKKLDIEKKYADVQFAVTAAEIVSNTALAIMQAYAQLGPIAGSVAAALMGITGAAQLAVANAERKKVKSMTLSGSSSSDAPKTGEIKLKEGFAEGGYNSDKSFADGGYTGSGDRYEVAGWLPVHGKEYITPAPLIEKYPAVAHMVREIDKYRPNPNKNPLPAGFADGGFNGDPSSVSNNMEQSNETNRKLIALLERLGNGDITVNTYYGITEMEAVQREKAEYESNFDLE